MTEPAEPHATPERLVSCFWSGDALRSRVVSKRVLTATLDVPRPPPRLLADWDRDTSQRLGLAPGDVEPLSLARARMRWPDYRQCVSVAEGWARTVGLRDLLDRSDVALMACRGARYHHDGEQYGSAAFCNLFVSEDKGLDLHFAGTGDIIPLVRGTVVVFDTCQPHAVVRRGGRSFDAADFMAGDDCTQVFLTWELSVEDVALANALQIDFDTDEALVADKGGEQVLYNGERGTVCPASGRWIRS